MGKVTQWLKDRLWAEIKATHNESSSSMPGDWITPSVNISSGIVSTVQNGKNKSRNRKKPEVAKQPEVSSGSTTYDLYGYRKWSNDPCQVNGSICRGEPSCKDCSRCIYHCTCVTPSITLKEEWLCTYCSTPQPNSNRKCDSCGAARPFTR